MVLGKILRLTITKTAIQLALISILIIMTASCGRAAEKADYNIIYISIDTLRADHLNCYGYKKHKVSPEIDALARDGILFEKHITAAPWTTPTHLSMFTSLSPSTHGMNASFQSIIDQFQSGGQFSRLPESRVTLAEVLKENGYATSAFTGGGPMDPRLGFGQGFDTYETSMFKLKKGNMGVMYDWLKKHVSKKIFLFWHHFEMHAPYLHADFLSSVMPPEIAAKMKKEFRQIKMLPEEKLWPAGAVDLRQEEVKILKKYYAFNRHVCETMYAACVSVSDRWLGQFLKTLRRKRIYDKSLIVLTSDHGEEFADHNPAHFYNMHGHTLYDEMVHVPLIIKLPNQAHAGKRVSDVSRVVDIMPTILDILSLKPKKDEMQGKSLRSTWEDSSDSKPRSAFSEALTTPKEKKSIRTNRYKYIITLDKNTVSEHGRSYVPEAPAKRELYDLRKDRKEKSNLLKDRHSPNFDKIAAGFEQRIRDHLPEKSGEAEAVDLDTDVIERLKSLGYIK
ncbi:MAG: sulfatase-like hydrolase/transferase [Deltaproteobacteria bacterium]|nr:sulfatase-like hydrolase/transferase [Deltaproteobacteria bacterium]